MKRKKVKIKRSLKERTNLILFLLFCVITLSLSVGYSALNEDLNISGEATFRVKEDIRIANVSLSETTNLGLENYTNKYGKDSITLGVGLPNIDSAVTYKIEIINSGSVSMWIDSITQEINNNSNMEYTLEGIGIKELINPGETKEFNLKVKYKEGITLPDNINLDTMLRFNFIKPVSTLAKGNNSNADATFFNNGPITKSSVETITFVPTLEVGVDAIGYWDASENKDGTVIAWYTDKDNNDLYELNIGGIGKVYAPENSEYLFRYFTKVVSIVFENYFDTSNTTNMTSMFQNCSSLVNLDLSNFNTSKVTTMYNMFYICSSLEDLNISSFDTSNVISMRAVFYRCNALENIDLSNFNTENVTDMANMFYNCSSLLSLDLTNFNTSKVTTFSTASFGMFSGCSKLTTLNLSNFETKNLKNMQYMFANCTSLTNLDISNFDTANVTNMSGLFMGCKALTRLDVTNFETSNVTTMYQMFLRCISLDSLDLNNFNTSNVTNMAQMFSRCSSIKNLNITSFNTSKVTNMSSMFGSLNMVNDGIAIESLEFGENFDTSNVANMSYMFAGCTKLTSLDVSKFNTQNVTDMHHMFQGCSSLTELDLSNFNTGNVTNMSGLFYNWYTGGMNLKKINLSMFDTSKVTNMKDMFFGCKYLETLDLSSFNTENVTNMSGMFYGCSSLTELDLSNFKTPVLTNISGTGSYDKPIFSGCLKLENLDISNFDFNKMTLYNGALDNVPAFIIISVNTETEMSFILNNIRNDLSNIKLKNG